MESVGVTFKVILGKVVFIVKWHWNSKHEKTKQKSQWQTTGKWLGL